MGEACARYVGPTVGYLVASRFEAEFQQSWFDPEFWGANATPVAKGGRGSAWFIRNERLGGLVLRHFCRGGLPGRFIKRAYLFLGADRVRSFAEFQLLDRLYRMGMPVPEPVAAGFNRRWLLLYRAQIIVGRIPDARPLSEYTDQSHSSIWRSAGVCVRRFHDADVYHADLNCMNILVADQIYLIDFDRGELRSEGSGDWKASNVARLERSVAKFFAESDAQVQSQLWHSFLKGYNDGA
ncbi:3-deoxy-D-manno-octulosonic acid kinase [Marinobacter sp. CHS3-4]|uniref:3-deoxy-D-manno-octulosonic acid kinase n=1 Tax=Marinobacter sp. CHS3-4 TaxID=3045174 RepID=UPI0024B5C3C8|nr:3-deoxy-D-manno-octulosonic acid kinase [Marinobacter sp. CHS3-4]MDI9246693.1 3-deoxy-D-manno-octulosonic acid kinase [Marinobacter sp. CHS3-4]